LARFRWIYISKIICGLSICAASLCGGCSRECNVSRALKEQWADKLIEEINLQRRMEHVPALGRNENLDEAARDMAIILLREGSSKVSLNRAMLNNNSQSFMKLLELSYTLEASHEQMPHKAIDEFVEENCNLLMDAEFEQAGVGLECKDGVVGIEFLMVVFADTAADGSVRPTLKGELWPDDSLEYYENRLFALLNNERERSSLNTLRKDYQLRGVARSYAKKMLKEGFFSHVEPGGTDFPKRVTGTNMDKFVFWGENLASIYSIGKPVEKAHEGLMNSPGHRANILNRRYTHVGIGLATDGEWWLFVQEFGQIRQEEN